MIRLFKATIVLIIFRKDWSGVGVSIYTVTDDNDKWNIDICLFKAASLAEAMALSCNIVLMNSFGYDNGVVKIWYCDSPESSRLTEMGKDVFLSVYIPLPWFNLPSLAWICHHGGRLFLLRGGGGREGGAFTEVFHRTDSPRHYSWSHWCETSSFIPFTNTNPGVILLQALPWSF